MGIEETTIKLLIERWAKQDIPIMPKLLSEIDRIKRNKKIPLPHEFIYFYSVVNGMNNFYPNKMDEEGFLFYPIEEVVSVEKEFSRSTMKNKQHIFVFAEYMHRSWWYGFESVDGINYQIGIIPTENIFKPITESLNSFIELYLEDSPKLYDYD